MSRAGRHSRAKTVREQPATDYGKARHSRLLLDTQIWLWWKAGDKRLGRGARVSIVEAGEVRFSVASMWEIAIKQAMGKLKLPSHGGFMAELGKHGFLPLAVEVGHAEAHGRLPMIHRDPFDRMLVAQALSEGLTLVTADTALMRYPVITLSGRE